MGRYTLHVFRYGEYQDTLSIRDVVLSMCLLVTSEEILLHRNKYYKIGKNWEQFNPSKRNRNKLDQSLHMRLIMVSSVLLTDLFVPDNLRYLLDKSNKKARVSTSKDYELVIYFYLQFECVLGIFINFSRDFDASGYCNKL